MERFGGYIVFYVTKQVVTSFKNLEIIAGIFSNHSAVKPETSTLGNFGDCGHMWIANNLLQKSSTTRKSKRKC